MDKSESLSTTKGQTDFQYKIVLVGDSGVGKSSIISRFTKNQFNVDCKTTIGVQFANKTIQIDGQTIKLQIWDTAGQQRYRSMASAYYRGAQGALLAYDVTRASTLQNLDKWIKQLKNYASEDIICLMIGNKSDLKQYRSVKPEHGEQFAQKNNMSMVQGSALQGKGIDQAFLQMIKQIHSKSIVLKRQKKPVAPVYKKQSLNIQNQNKKEKQCCGN